MAVLRLYAGLPGHGAGPRPAGRPLRRQLCPRLCPVPALPAGLHAAHPDRLPTDRGGRQAPALNARRVRLPEPGRAVCLFLQPALADHLPQDDRGRCSRVEGFTAAPHGNADGLAAAVQQALGDTPALAADDHRTPAQISLLQ